MRSRVKNLASRPFIRNVATVAMGTAMAQAIGIAFAPFITRLYGPEAYGLQSVFLSVVGMLTVVASLGYPTAIVLPKEDVEACGIIRLTLYIGLGMSFLAALALYFLSNPLLSLFHAEEIADFAWLIPFAIFFNILRNALSQWLIRKKEFQLTAQYGVATAFILNSVKSVLGFYYPTAWMLILNNAGGSLFSSMVTYLGWRWRGRRSQIKKTGIIKKPRLLVLARRYSDFPLLRTPQDFINLISQTLPVLLLSSYFGSAAAGHYSLALTVLGLPAGLIGSSVMSVFFPRINEAIHRGENAQSLIIKATKGMGIIGLPPMLLVMLAGPWLFGVVFGESWWQSGIYAQWLAPFLFLQYLNKPAVSAIPALRLQGGLLVYEVISTSLKILALWLGFAFFNSDVIAVALFSLLGTLTYLWLIAWVIYKSSAQIFVNDEGT